MNRLARRAFVAAFLVAFTAGLWAQSPDEKAVTAYFLKYRAAYEKSQKLDDILPFWSTSRLAEVEKTPKAERAGMFQMMKGMDDATGFAVTNVTKVSDSEYSLAVKGTSGEKKPVKGTVVIKKEGGVWKVAKEDYAG
jgi:hypothetical protein